MIDRRRRYGTASERFWLSDWPWAIVLVIALFGGAFVDWLFR